MAGTLLLLVATVSSAVSSEGGRCISGHADVMPDPLLAARVLVMFFLANGFFLDGEGMQLFALLSKDDAVVLVERCG